MPVPDSLGPAARGRRLEDFGWLRESTATDDLPDRLEADGYLFVRGLLDRAEVEAGRRELLERAELRQDYPMRSERLRSVIQGPRIMEFFAGLFGVPARSYDFIWLRHQPPSYGIAPHCDTVFMGRGTPDVLSCWIPFGDIALGGGGLMVLENSHRSSQQRLADYLRQDVDAYCENGPNGEAIRTGEMRWEHWRDYAAQKDWSGEITGDALELSEAWGGRWLTAPEYRMGDVLIFTLRTVHAGTDNESDTIRLSTDSRYQRADQPIDERWIRGEHGEDPIGHGLAAKQGKIC
jgi:hypothetical protein